MKVPKTAIAGLSVLTILSGCATTPLGPRVQAMPPPNKPYDAFQQDDYFCRNTAANAVQGQVEATNNQQVGTTLFTTILGAALGAAVGGGRGAAIGAAAGAGAGTLYGVNSNQWSQMSIQQRYDVVYAQCMYSRGDTIPGYGRPHMRPGNYPPPPPPGSPPPPPPGE
ncbi:MAG TPA: YMGG-like glycine zipper-containing protein [Stellaceae bacterium]|nr:YMGG-like glycine zipper-containing protein [Stellaceae bacterium]